jgi:hypothetical protein
MVGIGVNVDTVSLNVDAYEVKTAPELRRALRDLSFFLMDVEDPERPATTSTDQHKPIHRQCVTALDATISGPSCHWMDGR